MKTKPLKPLTDFDKKLVDLIIYGVVYNDRTQEHMVLNNTITRVKQLILDILPEEDNRPFPGFGQGEDTAIRETCYQQGRNEYRQELLKRIGVSDG